MLLKVLVCEFKGHTFIFPQVYIQPRPHTEIAGSLLSEVNDPSSNYSQLVAAGDIQVVLSYTYTKASLINIPPDEVQCFDNFMHILTKCVCGR